MHIQASKSSRTAQCGRLFIITLFLCIISVSGVNAHAMPAFGAPVQIKTTKLLFLQASNGGTTWTSFGNMLALGMQQIRQGTYHLLFLFTLLLPAVLVVSRKKQWSGFGGVGYSLVRIITIAGAFAIGHTITLFVCATGIVHFPTRVIEILMALGILLAAIHAYKPIISGMETYVAAAFGLIHGIAFARTLISHNTAAGPKAIHILAFNLGIELMLGFIIAMVIPWLIILSRINLYSGLRMAGAGVAAIAAIGWLIEQLSSQPNFITSTLIAVSAYQQWLVLLLAICAIFSFFMKVASSTAASSYSK